jgi:hypothetical protein
MPTVHENDIPKGYHASKNYNSNRNDNVPEKYVERPVSNNIDISANEGSKKHTQGSPSFRHSTIVRNILYRASEYI